MQHELIGKGSFTKVYSTGAKTVMYDTIDPVKWCYAEWLDLDRFYPVITHDCNNILVGTKYIKVRAPKQQLNARAYAYYKELRDVFAQGARGFDDIQELLNTVCYTYPKQAIQNQLDALVNYIDYDDICFEISPRNILTDRKGNLILSDIFYSYKLLKQKRKGA